MVMSSSLALGGSQVVVTVVMFVRFFRGFLGSSTRGAARGQPVTILHHKKYHVALYSTDSYSN